MRADYCPMANEPCQCMCDQPCSVHRLQPRKAVKLTDEEIKDAGFDSVEGRYMLPHTFARAIEQAVLKANGVTE